MCDFAYDTISENLNVFVRNLGPEVELEGWDVDNRQIHLKGTLEPSRVFAFLGEPNSPHQRLVAHSFTLTVSGCGRRLKDWVYDLEEDLGLLTPAQQAVVVILGERLETAVLEEFRGAERTLELQYRLQVQDASLDIPAALADQVEEIWLLGANDDAVAWSVTLFDEITPVPGVEHCYQDLYDVEEDFLADQARFGFVKFVTVDGDELVVQRPVAWRHADEEAWLTALWAEVSQEAAQEAMDALGGDHGHAG